LSAVPASHPAVAITAPARPRAERRSLRLPGAAAFSGLSLLFCGLAVVLAMHAGENAMAFWAAVSPFPLVSPIAYAYVLDLAIMHGVWLPVVANTLGMVFLLAAAGRAFSLLDEL
jgi:hypothetical protein